MDMSESQQSMEDEASCPLCRAYTGPLKLLRKHIGKHQEQLALFALPLSVREDDNEEEEGSDEPEDGDERGESTTKGDSRPWSRNDCEVPASASDSTSMPADIDQRFEDISVRCPLCGGTNGFNCPCQLPRVKKQLREARLRFLQKAPDMRATEAAMRDEDMQVQDPNSILMQRLTRPSEEFVFHKTRERMRKDCLHMRELFERGSDEESQRYEHRIDHYWLQLWKRFPDHLDTTFNRYMIVNWHGNITLPNQPQHYRPA